MHYMVFQFGIAYVMETYTLCMVLHNCYLNKEITGNFLHEHMIMLFSQVKRSPLLRILNNVNT